VFLQQIAPQAANWQLHVNKRQEDTHEDTVRCLDQNCAGGEVSDPNANETNSIADIPLGQFASTGGRLTHISKPP
jgi:hypothetical protein